MRLEACLAILISAAALSSRAFAYDSAAVQKTIERLYEEQDKQYKSKLSDVAFKMRAPGYVRQLAGGSMKVTREQEHDLNAKFLFNVNHVDWWITKIADWKFEPGTVVVQTTRDFQVDFANPPQTDKFRNILDCTDYWSESPDGWKITRSLETRSRDYKPK